MLKELHTLAAETSSVGRALTNILVKRACLEVYVRSALTASMNIAHARYQLSLRCGNDNPRPAQLLAKATEELRASIASLESEVESLVAATEELDEFQVVMKAPQAVPGLVQLLEDNRVRLKEVRRLLEDWRKSVK